MAVLVWLGDMFPKERRRPFTWRNLLFLRKNLPELLLGTLDSGVSNEVVPFGGRSWEDISPEFGGVAGRSGRMEGSDQDRLYFFFQT